MPAMWPPTDLFDEQRRSPAFREIVRELWVSVQRENADRERRGYRIEGEVNVTT